MRRALRTARAGSLTADACLVALGSYSPLVLRPIGIRLPVYPVKGCPITVPIDDASHAPESTIMDETHKVAVTRLGDRIRVGGTGHGTLGWTMAAGTGRVMADLISAKPTGISLDGLTVDRFGQAFTKPHRSAKHRMAARAGALKQRLNSPDDFQACSPRVVQDTNAQGARGGDCAGGQSAAG